VDDVVGPIIIVVVLLVLPVVFLIGGSIAAVIVGAALQKTAEADHAGSELIDLNR
jgi:flagellar basal body-associated protein FliL